MLMKGNVQQSSCIITRGSRIKSIAIYFIIHLLHIDLFLKSIRFYLHFAFFYYFFYNSYFFNVVIQYIKFYSYHSTLSNRGMNTSRRTFQFSPSCVPFCSGSRTPSNLSFTLSLHLQLITADYSVVYNNVPLMCVLLKALIFVQ